MNSLSPPLQAVIDVFSGPLQGVRFADIDGDGLGNLATEVETLGGEVEAQEMQLASLREALAQKQETLLVLAQQALAYARIYAESDEALSAELNEITLPRAAKPRKASVKSPPERGAKASKDDTENGVEHAAVAEQVEAAVTSKSKRKTSAAQPVEVQAEEELAVPTKGARRKLPTRVARATR